MTALHGPTFYHATYSYRSSRTVRALLLALVAGTCPTLVLVNVLRGRPQAKGIVLLAVPFALLFAAAFIRGVRALVGGAIDTFIIDAAGITANEHRIPWSAITHLGFARASFSQAGAIRVSIDQPRVLQVVLQPNQRLTRQQFRALADQLGPWLQEHHPRVQIERLEP